MKIYLDDERIPNDKSWTVVQTLNDFIKKIEEVGLKNIDIISFDHDLGPSENGDGYDAAKWLVGHYMEKSNSPFPKVYVHSHNPIGSDNIVSYINGFLKFMGKKQTAEKNQEEKFTVPNKKDED